MHTHREPCALVLAADNHDALIEKALAAAGRSWAPYSGNLAGCCLETVQGDLYAGCTAESAAYNPGVTALQSAWVQLAFARPQADRQVARVVLVEIVTLASQKGTCEMLLAALAPGVALEYYQVRHGP